MIAFIYSYTVYTYCDLVCNRIMIFWVKKGKSAQSLCTPVITLMEVTGESHSTPRRAKGLVCRDVSGFDKNFFFFYDGLYKIEELSIEILFEFVTKTRIGLTEKRIGSDSGDRRMGVRDLTVVMKNNTQFLPPPPSFLLPRRRFPK